MYFKQQIVRPAELAATLGVSTVTLWSWRRKGILPEPMTLGPRFIGWRNDVLNDWLKAQE
tara:strand:- start:1099 stop:1278 length:180 start_codon:yes stop_codon:yes gene_type:complete